MTWHTTADRVAWVDTDASGRIHFSAAFRFVERAETSLFRARGLGAEEAIEYPRRHVEAEYLIPLHFDDALEVAIRVEQIGTTSIRFGWELRRDGSCAIRGTHTVVRVGSDGRPKPISTRLRSLLDQST